MNLSCSQSQSADVDTRPHLSFSQLRTYTLCPLQWQLQRRFAPEFVSCGLVFGGAIHKAIETFYRGRKENRAVGREEMLAAYDAHWAREGGSVRYSKGETVEGLRQTAERMLDRFLSDVRPSRPIAVEMPFEVRLAVGVPPVVGFVDLVEIRGDTDGVERLHFVDFKTAARRPASAEDVDPDQVVLYAIAADRIGLLREHAIPYALRYDILTKTKSPEMISVPVACGPGDTGRLLQKIANIHRAMEQGLVFPNPNWMCATCGHQTLCRRWPRIEETAKSMRPRPANPRLVGERAIPRPSITSVPV